MEFGTTHAGHRMRPGDRGDLHHGHAHPARRATDQHPVAGPAPGLGDQGVAFLVCTQRVGSRRLVAECFAKPLVQLNIRAPKLGYLVVDLLVRGAF